MAAMATMPRLNALRGSLHDRAEEHRYDDEQSSEQAALDNGGGLAALQQTRANNLKSRVTAMNNPEWDDFFQSMRDASGGAPVKMVGGASPDGSNQLTGLGAPASKSGAVVDGPYGAPGNDLSGANGSVDALRGRTRATVPHDVWLAKTRQRIYGEA